MNVSRETFGKSERLCSLKIISGLFETGQVIYTPLLKVVWDTAPLEIPSPVQVTFSVAKRSFRLAVTRNLIKRRLREAYRKNKQILYDHLIQGNKQVVMVVILRGNKIPEYHSIETDIKQLITRLINLTKINEKN
jgi:ribonuclease P protein component